MDGDSFRKLVWGGLAIPAESAELGFAETNGALTASINGE
jgi:hypothetical protein